MDVYPPISYIIPHPFRFVGLNRKSLCPGVLLLTGPDLGGYRWTQVCLHSSTHRDYMGPFFPHHKMEQRSDVCYLFLIWLWSSKQEIVVRGHPCERGKLIYYLVHGFNKNPALFVFIIVILVYHYMWKQVLKIVVFFLNVLFIPQCYLYKTHGIATATALCRQFFFYILKASNFSAKPPTCLQLLLTQLSHDLVTTLVLDDHWGPEVLVTLGTESRQLCRVLAAGSQKGSTLVPNGQWGHEVSVIENRQLCKVLATDSQRGSTPIVRVVANDYIKRTLWFLTISGDLKYRGLRADSCSVCWLLAPKDGALWFPKIT